MVGDTVAPRAVENDCITADGCRLYKTRIQDRIRGAHTKKHVFHHCFGDTAINSEVTIHLQTRSISVCIVFVESIGVHRSVRRKFCAVVLSTKMVLLCMHMYYSSLDCNFRRFRNPHILPMEFESKLPFCAAWVESISETYYAYFSRHFERDARRSVASCAGSGAVTRAGFAAACPFLFFTTRRSSLSLSLFPLTLVSLHLAPIGLTSHVIRR